MAQLMGPKNDGPEKGNYVIAFKEFLAFLLIILFVGSKGGPIFHVPVRRLPAGTTQPNPGHGVAIVVCNAPRPRLWIFAAYNQDVA